MGKIFFHSKGPKRTWAGNLFNSKRVRLVKHDELLDLITEGYTEISYETAVALRLYGFDTGIDS